MFEEKRYIVVAGKQIQLGYEKYTQSATMHLSNNMVALNNKFPNLVAYGFIQYIKELMAMRPECKIQYCDDMLVKMANMMNMEKSLVKEIIEYCFKIKLFKKVHTYRELERSDEWYIVYPDFLEELVTLQSKRINEEAEIRRNEHSESFLAGRRSEIAKKKEMVREMRVFMIFTPEIKRKAELFYPDVNVEDSWDEFTDMCEGSYLEWHTQLNPENYETTFFSFLNKRVAKISAL